MYIVEVKPGLKFPGPTLISMLPTVKLALLFGKIYKLDASQLGNLFYVLFGDSDVIKQFVAEDSSHSHELQDYVVDVFGDVAVVEDHSIQAEGEADDPQGVLLPELWKSLEIKIADTIAAVAEQLKDVVSHMPGRQGKMMFEAMSVLNSRRPVIGDFKAQIKYDTHPPNLVILDVSGSMSEETVKAIVEDVVALSYEADASLAVVSDESVYWEPGGYSVESVLDAATFCGTHYETLAPLFDQDWGVVVTIADYDSSHSAKELLKECPGKVGQVLDISLVSRPTFLSECVGQLSDEEVRPLMMAKNDYVLMGY